MGSHSLTARHQRPNGPHPEGEHEKGGVRCLEWTRVPQLVQWMATLRCPLSCPHCLAVSRNSGFSDMPLVTVFGLIDQISFMGVEEFLVTGGEPLAREDLPEVIRYPTRSSRCLRGSPISGCCRFQHQDIGSPRRIVASRPYAHSIEPFAQSCVTTTREGQ